MTEDSQNRIIATIDAFTAFVTAVRNGENYDRVEDLGDEATFQNLGMMLDFTMDFDTHMSLFEFKDIEVIEAIVDAVRGGKSAEDLLSQIDKYINTLFQLLES